MEKETLKQAFRLNDYESLVLSAVFNNKKLSMGEIAKLSGVPRSRVYDVAETLKKKGFINIIQKNKKLKKTCPTTCELITVKQMISNWEKRLIKDTEDKISYCKKVLGDENDRTKTKNNKKI